MNAPLIMKPRDIPRDMLKAEALSRRLIPHHHKKTELDQTAKNLRAGYNGEKSLDFMLGFLQDPSHHILHDLRIRDPNDFFQIDTLIPTPEFILINEVKNIAGTVMYEESGQVTRIAVNGEETSMGNHIEQVNLQHLRLQRFIRAQKLPAIPIEKLIVHSNPNTIVKNISNSKSISDMVIHKEQLLSKIHEFTAIHKTASYTIKQLEQLTQALLNAHTPNEADILKKYDMTIKDLSPGVFCPACGRLPMEWKRANWRCRQCGCASKTAHMQALEDYSLLLGNRMSNREARAFLKLQDASVVKRLLKKFKQEGKNKGTKYILSF